MCEFFSIAEFSWKEHSQGYDHFVALIYTKNKELVKIIFRMSLEDNLVKREGFAITLFKRLNCLQDHGSVLFAGLIVSWVSRIFDVQSFPVLHLSGKFWKQRSYYAVIGYFPLCSDEVRVCYFFSEKLIGVMFSTIYVIRSTRKRIVAVSRFSVSQKTLYTVQECRSSETARKVFWNP